MKRSSAVLFAILLVLTIGNTLLLALPTAVSMGPQAMEGDLKVNPGDMLSAGYDFTMPGTHAAASVLFTRAMVTFQAQCVSGSGGGTIVVAIPDSTSTDQANNSQWLPSGDQHSPLVYQGSIAVPNLCAGGQLTLKSGGTFTAQLQSTDTTDKVNIRWHYSANGSAGGWSGTASFIPGPVATSPLVSIRVTPASVSLGRNATQQYTATGTYADNSTQNLTNSVVWTSGSPSIVSISATGLAKVLVASDSAISITASTTNAAGKLLTDTAWLSALSTLPISCPTPTIDMKLLVVTNGKTEADFPAIEQILDYLGTPYNVFDMADAVANPQGLTALMLSDGNCHGYYQGVIFANGGYIYSSWMPVLNSYEQTFGVRQVNWYTYPNGDFGFQPPSPAGGNPLNASFTSAGKTTFWYANTPVTISNASSYLALPLGVVPSGRTITPLLTDASGNALSLIYDLGDGRQYLTQTFDSNQYLTHNLVLAYGLVNWVTKGIFLGEYHVYAAAQVDDVFIDDSEWIPGTPCGTASDAPSLPTFRITGTDVTALVNWQKAVQHDPLFSNFRLSLAFNGVGTTGDTDWTGPLPNGDTLTPALKANQLSFNWINHTYDHLEPLIGTRTQISAEVSQNNAVALQLKLTLNPANMVTPGITGLDDPNTPGYLVASGIKYVVTDTSQVGKLNNGPNPSPNVGIVNSFAPGLYEVPRFPNNIFFNTANWADNRAEWNCIYQSDPNFHDYTASGILDNISSQFLNNMLLGNMNPEMFHQTNLHFSDNAQELGLRSPYVSSLISDVYQATFNKYKKLYQFPVLSLPLDQLGQAMQKRDAYNRSNVAASLAWANGVPTTISITVPSAAAVPSAVIPVTGLNSAGAESYGGKKISHVTVNAGQAVTLPVL
jgi:hypothetical protein